MYKRLITLVLALHAFCNAHTQSTDWAINGNFNFGCSYILHDNFKGVRFPGYRLFCSFGLNAIYQKHLVLNYGPSLSFYTKSIGANLNPLIPDIQLDLANSFGAGYCWGPQLSYNKLYRTLDNSAYYNAVLNQENAIILSSNFILNNHKRNQVNGCLTGSFNNFTINYYNDGGPPFNYLPLADNFDRYWTGGITGFIHTRSNYNSVEFGFNQFTGYKSLLFEACDQLGINMPDYNADNAAGSNSSRPSINNYNTSAYYATVHLNPYASATVGWMGSLKIVNQKTLKTAYFGLQEIIHAIGSFPFHPNQDDGKLFLGANFNACNNEKP